MQHSQITSNTLFQQMQAVSQLQSRANFYLGLYQNFVIESPQLYQQQSIPNQNECTSLPIERHEQQHQNKEKTQYLEMDGTIEDIEFEPKKINLSRIFNEIRLGDQVIQSNNLEICLFYEQKQIMLSLGKKDNSYNLSNFSSFNNNPSNNYQQFDIKDLCCLIQQKIGRQLNKRGMENIIGQIQAAVLSETQRQLKQSQITQHSLFHSDINRQNTQYIQPQFKPLTDNKLILNAVDYLQDKTVKGVKPQQNQKPNKQNNSLHYKRKTAPNISKQLRIIRKNCFKNSLVMVYSDMKQLENFCISNKIYGKDKDRIVKAIRQNKNIVSLD